MFDISGKIHTILCKIDYYIKMCLSTHMTMQNTKKCLHMST